MKRFTLPVRECIANRIWMPALTTALTLPDICSWLEAPVEPSVGKRYKRWAVEWIEPKYTFVTGRDKEKQVFLTGADLYALRCAICHSGTDDITRQSTDQALESFIFRYPDGWIELHCNRMNDVLQLQVDTFCLDICDAVEAWETKNAKNFAIQAQKKSLIRLEPTSSGF